MSESYKVISSRCGKHLPKTIIDVYSFGFMRYSPPCTIFDIYEKNSAIIKSSKKCDICNFELGLVKVKNILARKRAKLVIDTLYNNWITPRSDGRSAYAEWSWQKMQRECFQ